MPLREFIDETIKSLLTDAPEVLTERVLPPQYRAK
jgi:hypothetical protein